MAAAAAPTSRGGVAFANGDPRGHAPVYPIPDRKITALEHPMIIKDVDKAIQTFGRNPNFSSIVEDSEPHVSVPLYLRYDNPVTRPIMSHGAASHNVVLKVTVPKRTGRKRKRDSAGPWTEEATSNGEQAHAHSPDPTVSSVSRNDDPRLLRRKLADNVGSYSIESVGLIKQTHRYRGLTDFQQSITNAPFMSEFVNKVVPGDVAELRNFKFGSRTTSPPPNVELPPPPTVTNITLPFPYLYTQNPHVREVADKDGLPRIINTSALQTTSGYVLKYDQYPAPSGPSRPPDRSDPQMAIVLGEIEKAMDARPIWTRRGLINSLSDMAGANQISANLIRKAIPFVGYQFKGGPWRDSLVRYGVDPRKDPSYRKYQTLIFKLRFSDTGGSGQTWQSIRAADVGETKRAPTDNDRDDSHIFDGKSFCRDGKVWQVCDITDPMLAELFANAEVRETVDEFGSGWYHRGLWAKAKAIMKHKMKTIHFGRSLNPEDYEAALRVPDRTPEPGSKSISIPLPDLNLTEEETRTYNIRKYHHGLHQRPRDRTGTAYRVPIPKVGTGQKTSPSAAGASSEGDSEVASPSTDVAVEDRLPTVLEEVSGDGNDDDGSSDDGSTTSSSGEESDEEGQELEQEMEEEEEDEEDVEKGGEGAERDEEIEEEEEDDDEEGDEEDDEQDEDEQDYDEDEDMEGGRDEYGNDQYEEEGFSSGGEYA